MNTVLGNQDSVVIVGAGQGGFQASASLRENGFGGKITLIGDESSLPYQRPPLSKTYLAGALDLEGLYLRPPSFFTKHKVELLLDDPAIRLDRTAKQLHLASGQALAYSHLVLATGARARPFPMEGAGLGGVRMLRSLADADALRPDLARQRRIAVIGGGFIGMEFAAVAAAGGHKITVIEGSERIMARVLSPEMSDYVAGVHRHHRVDVLLGNGITRLVGENGQVTGVEMTDDNVMAADLVLVCIGVLPNVKLAEDAGLDICNGIAVNEHLQTSDPDISALGDCASYPSIHAGQRSRLESVQNAVDHARYIAARLTKGEAAGYSKVPWFWTHQYDLNIQVAGIGHVDDTRVVRGNPEEGKFSIFRFIDERLVCVESVNNPSDHMLARKMLASETFLTPEQAMNTKINLKALLQAPQMQTQSITI